MIVVASIATVEGKLTSIGPFCFCSEECREKYKREELTDIEGLTWKDISENIEDAEADEVGCDYNPPCTNKLSHGINAIKG